MDEMDSVGGWCPSCGWMTAKRCVNKKCQLSYDKSAWKDLRPYVVVLSTSDKYQICSVVANNDEHARQLAMADSALFIDHKEFSSYCDVLSWELKPEVGVQEYFGGTYVQKEGGWYDSEIL